MAWLFILITFRFLRRGGLGGSKVFLWNPFAGAAENAAVYRKQNERLLTLFGEISRYYSTPIGRCHIILLSGLVITTFASGIWMLAELKRHV
jgi:hypothetical protein